MPDSRGEGYRRKGLIRKAYIECVGGGLPAADRPFCSVQNGIDGVPNDLN